MRLINRSGIRPHSWPVEAVGLSAPAAQARGAGEAHIAFVKILVVALLAFFFIRDRARGEREQRIVGTALKWGLVLGGIGFALGVAVGVFLGLGTGAQEMNGLAPLFGLIILGPIAFQIGFALGFFLGGARGWWREQAV